MSLLLFESVVTHIISLNIIVLVYLLGLNIELIVSHVFHVTFFCVNHMAPLEERRLKLSMHYYLKTRAFAPTTRHIMPYTNLTQRDLYFPRPNGRRGMT